jgi:glycine/D-amino acid oxidase-like deaminating enzyme
MRPSPGELHEHTRHRIPIEWRTPAQRLLSDFPATHAPWLDHPLPRFPALEHDLAVDVVIVGAGLTGITTAYLLKQEGVRVALLDRARVAAADTGHSTAHLTYVTDDRISELVARFGRECAQAFWEGGRAAIDEIERLAARTGAQCDLRRVPGFLHAPRNGRSHGRELERLERDADLARDLGFDTRFIREVPMMGRAGVRFADQARFHPRKYLEPLLRAIDGDGSFVFEHTTFEGVNELPVSVRANGHNIRCDYIVIATHNPLMARDGVVSAAAFRSRFSLYTSYVLGADIPGKRTPEALFWDTNDPYDYARVDSPAAGDSQYVIFGGNDVKSGQEPREMPESREAFAIVEARLKDIVPDATVVDRWLGEVVVTDDGLPFIGENAHREFIATGFCGNGFTLGTLSAMLARDRYLGRDNAWFEHFRVDRRLPFAP